MDERPAAKPRRHADVEPLVAIGDAAEVTGEGHVVLHQAAFRRIQIVQAAHRITAAAGKSGLDGALTQNGPSKSPAVNNVLSVVS